jgi:hypothetical protein
VDILKRSVIDNVKQICLFYLERDIPPGDCIFDVITRNQAIEEFKIVVRRLHGMLTGFRSY